MILLIFSRIIFFYTWLQAVGCFKRGEPKYVKILYNFNILDNSIAV